MPVEIGPFATIDDLKKRWPDFPVGGDDQAETLLEDASQYMVDVCSSAMAASANTRKRIVCAVVRRSMQAETTGMGGMESMQMGAGPYQETFKPTNPHGDFYLTKQEKISLGCGRQKAFSIDLLAGYGDEG